jgi:hypothetical protein
MGRAWRIKSPQRVVDELLSLKERHRIEGVWFKDSIFNLDREWVREFCRIMIERNAGITWQALTRIDLIDEEELKLMLRAGLTQLDLGIETGSPKSLTRLKKGISVEKIRKGQTGQAVRQGLRLFMIGIPGEDGNGSPSDLRAGQKPGPRPLDLEHLQSVARIGSLKNSLPKEIEPYRLDYHQVHFTEAAYDLRHSADTTQGALSGDQ